RRSGGRGAARLTRKRLRVAAAPPHRTGAAMRSVPGAKPTLAQQPNQSHLAERAGVERFRAQHLDLGERAVETEIGTASVTVDQAESPLAWLARRKGRDGRPLIEPVQLQAAERLRAEFTRAQLMPRLTP